LTQLGYAAFTCDGRAFGDGSSPALNWSHEPKGTKSYAILLKDLTIEAGESQADPGLCPNLLVTAFGAPAEVHNDVFILYAFKDASIVPPPYDPGPDPSAPLNPVRQLASFFETHPSLLGKAELKFTSDATPATCPGFPNPPFTCAGP